MAGGLSTMGLRLSPGKTLFTPIDQGLAFLCWGIQRQRQPGPQPGENAHDAVSIPGNSDPDSVAGRGMRNHTTRNGACGAPVARKRARRVREAARGNPPVENTGRAPRVDLTRFSATAVAGGAPS